ncbi:hypothetical protein VKT23_011792 [Stygiomarasmius scandens]|uniref:FAD/NAD(P)-binding domain-containing protein n=1 Tax=Marasmiellus scandens TaxID=2682957 RepID=A0ABR1JBE2_9AGAR
MVSSLVLFSVAVLVLAVGLRYIVRKVRLSLLESETALLAWPILGKERDASNKIPGTAVICGGSLAGLLAARVCHDHFQRVIIVEPEAWLSTEDGITTESWTQKNKRARVVQYTSLHGNLAPVTDGLLRLFPKFEEECHRSGINLVPADFKSYLSGHRFLVPHNEFSGSLPRTAQAGRQGTETLIRRLTLNKKEYPNISQIPGTVTGVRADPANPKFLKAVTIETETGLRELEAALVVDCTGPARAGQEWIRHAGFVEEPGILDKLTVSYDPRIRYSSFKVHIPEDLAAKLPEYGDENATGGLFLYKSDPNVGQTYIGAMKVDGDFGMTTTLVVPVRIDNVVSLVEIVCGAWGSQELPNDIDGVRQFLRANESESSIPDWIWKFLDLCQETEDTMRHSKVRIPPSYWTHLELAQNLPANWIASGDSVCRVNPVFAQGTAKAMMGAVSLNNVLQELDDIKSKTIPEDFSQRFFRRQADKIKPLWARNKMADYSYKTTIPEEGETLETGSLIRWYVHKLEELSDKDPQIGALFWRTLHSYGTSIDALHPVFIGKVFWSMIFGK